MIGHGVADPAEIIIAAKAVSDYRSRHQIMRMDDREQEAIKVGWRESGVLGSSVLKILCQPN